MGRKFDETMKQYAGEMRRTLPQPLTDEQRAERAAFERDSEAVWIEQALRPDHLAVTLESVGVGQRTAATPIDAEKIPEPVRSWASLFPVHSGAGLMLVGAPGTGKTTAAAWCMREFWSASVRTLGSRANAYALIKRIRAADLIAAIFAKTRELEHARERELLVIDDWGASYEHDWPLGEMDALVDARWESGKATIVTTNLFPHRRDGGDLSFESRYPRAMSRLCDRRGPGLVIMGGKDQRR